MNSYAHKRQQILQQMELLQTMERGSLQEEARPAQGHPDQTVGPYFKHQVWEEGRNLTRRVPAAQAPALAEAIAGRKKFEQLAEQFVATTVAMTRAGQASPLAKKNARSFRPPWSRKARSCSVASSTWRRRSKGSAAWSSNCARCCSKARRGCWPR